MAPTIPLGLNGRPAIVLVKGGRVFVISTPSPLLSLPFRHPAVSAPHRHFRPKHSLSPQRQSMQAPCRAKLPVNTRSMYRALCLDLEAPDDDKARKDRRIAKSMHFVAARRPVPDHSARVAKPRLLVKSSRQSRLQSRRKDVGWGFEGGRRPQGMRNPSNWCYRRAVLSSLCHLPAIVNWAAQCAQSHGGSSHVQAGTCMPCNLDKLAKAVFAGHPMAPALSQVDRSFRAAAPANPLWPWLASHEQADAHEALSFLAGQHSTLRGMLELTTAAEWACSDCTTIHTSPLIAETGLSLGIQHVASDDLAAHIAGYFAQDVDELVCELPACNSKGRRRRTARIHAAPDVLAIQLVRFNARYDARTGRMLTEKVGKAVRYGPALDLSAYATPAALAGGPLRYRLDAVVAHAGSLDGGHYVSFCRGPGGIHEFDDDCVSAVAEQRMLVPGQGFTPYILLYAAV